MHGHHGSIPVIIIICTSCMLLLLFYRKEYVDGGATLVIDARDGKSHKPTKHLLEKLAV